MHTVAPVFLTNYIFITVCFRFQEIAGEFETVLHEPCRPSSGILNPISIVTLTQYGIRFSVPPPRHCSAALVRPPLLGTPDPASGADASFLEAHPAIAVPLRHVDRRRANHGQFKVKGWESGLYLYSF